MSTADLIYQKTKSLPGKLQSEVLEFLDYLDRRRAAQIEAAKWQSALRETQTLPVAQKITEEEIAAEIAAYRSGQ
ncbi:MAG TPA: hypothetical protein VFM25_06070 [Verrucomicrobiae bacterium]|nr:hypothetical protein [Verrucomicrobiae bacterium]